MNNKTRIIIAVIVGLTLPGILLIGGVAIVSSVTRNAVQNSSSVETANAETLKPLNACNVVSLAEIKKVAGESVAVNTTTTQNNGEPRVYPTNEPTSSMSGCYYDATDDSSLMRVTIRLSQAVGAQSDSAIRIFNQGKEGAPNREAVAGLGDDAYTAGTAAYVRKGANSAVVLVNDGQEKNVKQSIALARLVVDKL